MKIDKADISNYFISYQGHGMIEHATSTNSIAHVINHERRHIAQFEDQANFENKEIVSEEITINYQYIDGKIVAVAGRAKAIMRDKAGDDLKTSMVKIQNGPSDLEGASQMNLPSKQDQQLDQAIQKIEAALTKIQNMLDRIDDGKGNPDDESAAAAIKDVRQNKEALERKRQELSARLNEIRSKKLEKMAKDLLSGIARLMNDSVNLIKAIYSLKSGKEKPDSSDEYAKMEVPDYSLQYTGLLFDTMI